MMAPEYYVFTDSVGEVIPDHVTHVLISEALKFVPMKAFYQHPNIQEVICHDGVEKIEKWAFWGCPSLRRVTMPGVKEVERSAFDYCTSLTYVECGKLEIIGECAFCWCNSLSSINLPSVKIVEMRAFSCCPNLTNVEFGKDLESIGCWRTFFGCRSLECITLPLKDGMISEENVFQGCVRLRHINLVGGVHETVAALLMDEWKHDTNKEIYAINKILDGQIGREYLRGDVHDHAFGEKAQKIREWIRSVLHKYIYYKAEHRRYVNEAAATLKLTLPHDIVLKNILPFVELPSDTSEGED